MCIKELLSGHPTHYSHSLAWSNLAFSSLASLDSCPIELWVREVAPAQERGLEGQWVLSVAPPSVGKFSRMLRIGSLLLAGQEGSVFFVAWH